MERASLLVVGGGAAGFFGAIAFAETHPDSKVILIEKTNAPLAKVRISGGGRCNVTHACFDPMEFVKNYPRGGKALIGPMHRFQPRNTIDWFERRGVQLKTEEDGRIFPISDNSQTIIDCLTQAAKKLEVQVITQQSIEKITKHSEQFEIGLGNGEMVYANRVLLATGSSKSGYVFAEQFGHTIITPVPSLFSFNLPESPLNELSGITVEDVEVSIEGSDLKQRGPLLITHWGFSGPSVLKLSAWAARHLQAVSYEAVCNINWLPTFSRDTLTDYFLDLKQQFPSQTLLKATLLPKNLWKKLLDKFGMDSSKRLSDLSKKQLNQLVEQLQKDRYEIKGKTLYKQEFVTAGGVCLEEVNFKTMESRLCPGLYFAGEILDIDGVTGGFNFQNAWTTAWIAGNAPK